MIDIAPLDFISEVLYKFTHGVLPFDVFFASLSHTSLTSLLKYIPILGALLTASAFFSSCEAAYFSLSQQDRRSLAEGGPLARLAASLANQPEQVLNSILLGNLIVNLLIFTISSGIAFRLRESEYPQLAGLFGFGALLFVIIFCEILPKNFAVPIARRYAIFVALPLSVLVRGLSPALPMLKITNILVRRLFFPKFKPEPYLHVSDLTQAVEMSNSDQSVLLREQRVLQNLVSLSKIRVEELMRPRTHLKTFRPPVTLERIVEECDGHLPRSGFLLLTEANTDEIITAVDLSRLPTEEITETMFTKTAQPVLYIPWSTPVAGALDQLRQSPHDIMVVVNEFGETIGLLTLDDILETLFTRDQGCSRRLSDQREILRINESVWQINGLTGLRQLERKLNLTFPESSSVTVAGLLLEKLERFPQPGDSVLFGDTEFRVIEKAQGTDDIIIYLVKLSEE